MIDLQLIKSRTQEYFSMDPRVRQDMYKDTSKKDDKRMQNLNSPVLGFLGSAKRTING
jgi:hypothetical protein